MSKKDQNDWVQKALQLEEEIEELAKKLELIKELEQFGKRR